MYTKDLQHSDTAIVEYNIERTKTIKHQQSQFLNIIPTATQLQRTIICRFIRENFVIQYQQQVNGIDCYFGRVVAIAQSNSLTDRPLLGFPKDLFQVQFGTIDGVSWGRPVLKISSVQRLIFVQNLRSDYIYVSKLDGAYSNSGNIIFDALGGFNSVFIPYINCIISYNKPLFTQIIIGYSFPLYSFQYQCRMSPSEFNRSNNITAYTQTSEGVVQTHSPYITTVGLYNDSNQLLAVGKISQPIKKSSVIQQTVIIQFDYVP